MSGWIVLVLLAAFAAAHVSLAAGLWKRIGPARGTLAFFLPPVAPYLGFRERMSRRSWAWIATLGCYAAAVAVLRACT